MGELHLGFEIVALVVLCAILLADLLLVIKRPHLPSMKECAGWIGFYVGLALVFAVVLFFVGGAKPLRRLRQHIEGLGNGKSTQAPQSMAEGLRMD